MHDGPLSPEEHQRYARHLSLDAIGAAGQRRLRASSVLVVGAGGLGSPSLLYLAAAGVGRLGLIDFDAVDVSNLQRQILHGTGTLGQSKASSAHDRLVDLNPQIQIEAHHARLDAHNALDLVSRYDVIVDGSDRFATRFLVSDACEIIGRPLVYGAVERFAGQVSVFHYRSGPSYRDLFAEPPPPDLAPTCAEAGILGVLPGVIGTLQATEALKLLLQIGEPLSGRLLIYDALAARFRTLTLTRDPGRAPITELTTPVAPSVPWTRLRRDTLDARRAAGWSPTVIDLRTPAEARAGQLSGTHHRIEPEDLRASHVENGPTVLYCASGARSTRACRALIQAGARAEHLFELAGGLSGRRP